MKKKPSEKLKMIIGTFISLTLLIAGYWVTPINQYAGFAIDIIFFVFTVYIFQLKRDTIFSSLLLVAAAYASLYIAYQPIWIGLLILWFIFSAYVLSKRRREKIKKMGKDNIPLAPIKSFFHAILHQARLFISGILIIIFLVFCGIFLISGLLMLTQEWSYWRVKFTFTETQCKLLDKDVEKRWERHNRRFDNWYYPRLNVQYKIAGKTYQKWVVDNTTRAANPEAIRTITTTGNYTVINQTYSCWYDSDYPEMIVIRNERGNLLVGLICVFFPGLLIAGITRYLFVRIKKTLKEYK